MICLIWQLRRKATFYLGHSFYCILESLFVDLYEASLLPALLPTVVLAELPPAFAFVFPESIDIFSPNCLDYQPSLKGHLAALNILLKIYSSSWRPFCPPFFLKQPIYDILIKYRITSGNCRYISNNLRYVNNITERKLFVKYFIILSQLR